MGFSFIVFYFDALDYEVIQSIQNFWVNKGSSDKSSLRFRMVIKRHNEGPSRSHQYRTSPSNETVHPIIRRLLKDRYCNYRNAKLRDNEMKLKSELNCFLKLVRLSTFFAISFTSDAV